ncbi:MAG TPA: transcription antitermination factor NusB [Parachlamydiaceae bacterium]|nr:transcription antitermination factor NusB [Parachlamydiaceae bacterium]
MKAREAAYLALLASMRHEDFIAHSLEKWMKNQNPSKLDFAFSYEIASGSARMALALDHIGAGLSTNKKLSLKVKERALVRTAIYQYCFMDKVPLYAIVNETIEIAKKYCHRTFVAYLNALLRKLEDSPNALPSGSLPNELSIRYSYPLHFVEALISDYGLESAEELLKKGNMPPKTMVRVRPGVDLSLEAFKFLQLQTGIGISMAILDKAASLSALVELPEIYIQNATPVALVAALAERTEYPSTILDLCASPGGKLLAAHDLYPKAKLFANDVSPEKIMRLSQNLNKYGVMADLNCGPGESYETKEHFDIIILDVPCSNSGVLNKRPEARWRLTEEAIGNLEMIQLRLIEHAATLLAPGGVIWYLTCSILKSENEALLNHVRNFGLAVEYTNTVLPNEEGWDGGFSALLKRM